MVPCNLFCRGRLRPPAGSRPLAPDDEFANDITDLAPASAAYGTDGTTNFNPALHELLLVAFDAMTHQVALPGASVTPGLA